MHSSLLFMDERMGNKWGCSYDNVELSGQEKTGSGTEENKILGRKNFIVNEVVKCSIPKPCME